MRNSKNKIRVFVLITLLVVAGTVMVWLMVTSQPISNPYFFEKGITEQEYEGYIYPLSSKEIRENVTLKITRLEEFRDSELYALELEQLDVTDTDDMISMGRQYLGYFYVKDSQIYRLPVKDYTGFTEEQTQSIIKVIREDEKSFLDMCHIVCSEEVVEDAVDDQGYHSGIKADENQRIYYFYNGDTSGTKDYEKIVWEKGKGIVYYQRGAGNMLMHIEFGVDLEESGNNESGSQHGSILDISSFQMEKQVYSFNLDQDVNADIEISYPQLTGYIDEKKQESINKLILGDIEKVVKAGLDDIGEELALELDYEVKFINANVISIFYQGVYGESGYQNGFEPIAICTNIDLTKEKIISLNDVVADFDELQRLLLSDVFENISVWDGIKGTDKISREYSGNKEKLLTNLQNDRFDFANHYIEWYITDDAFVVVSLYSGVYQEYSQYVSNMEGIFSDYFYELQNGVTRSTNNHEIYMEFLGDRRSVDGMTVTDITVPTGEPGKRYFTEYTFADSDTDGSDELHIRSERYYYIIDCENDDLSVWKSLHPRTELLNNGDYLYTHIGGAPFHHDYKYFRLNPKGEEVWSISYSWYDENENGEYDENDLYFMQDKDVLSYEEWKKVKEDYLSVDTDRISWTALNEKDTEKMYSYEVERAFEHAQENRIQEVAAALSKSIGKWSVTELTLPMAIGQDSTRSQLGMELSQTDIEIFKDFSVQLGEERYMVHDIAIRDYEWYLDRLRQGPYFAEGLIVELYYENEEDKRFSICLAENEMYLFSYAYGFYNVVSQAKDSNVMPEELEENVLDMLKEAYRKRYGDIESQLESMCGTWIGEKYSFSDELVKLVGKYDMELQYRNEKFVIVFEGEEIETELVEVLSASSYTEEQCLELLEVPSQIQSYLKLYSEGYILHLKQKDNDIFVAVSKGDLELEEQERKMKILINEELYSFW